MGRRDGDEVCVFVEEGGRSDGVVFEEEEEVRILGGFRCDEMFWGWGGKGERGVGGVGGDTHTHTHFTNLTIWLTRLVDGGGSRVC